MSNVSSALNNTNFMIKCYCSNRNAMQCNGYCGCFPGGKAAEA